ncbi:MAG: helix-turn-helix transcriptional regulator [Terrimicrobiaceae bacterium]|nr:helix-turn-helix transcriptional regulator [Terrimicrobiaceae bacterium]
MSQTFGQYIRALREQAGLTQRALSAAVGFRSLAHLSDIESGKRHPARETLPKFAEALGVTVNELESRDERGPVEAVKALFAVRPEMVGAFLKVVEAARTMEAQDLVERVCGRPSAAPPPPTSAPPEPTPPPAAVEEAPVAADPNEVSDDASRKVSTPKKTRDDQPSLF